MTESLQREVRLIKGYDYRDDPADQRGAHGMEILLIVRGPLGAIVGSISTGWMARPLVGHYMRLDGPQKRRAKPGVDGRLNDHFPSGAHVSSHAPEQRRDYWSGPRDNCDWIGAPCYGDMGFTVSDELLERVVAGGDEAGFAFLGEIYADWLAPESVPA